MTGSIARQLDWKTTGYDGQTLQASAFGIKVFYQVRGVPGNWELVSPGENEYVSTPGYGTQVAAKRAGQIDFERRVEAELR